MVSLAVHVNGEMEPLNEAVSTGNVLETSFIRLEFHIIAEASHQRMDQGTEEIVQCL